LLQILSIITPRRLATGLGQTECKGTEIVLGSRHCAPDSTTSAVRFRGFDKRSPGFQNFLLMANRAL
jgi:hypothetical protein